MFLIEHQCSQRSSGFWSHVFPRTVLCPRKSTLSIHFSAGIHSTLSVIAVIIIMCLSMELQCLLERFWCQRLEVSGITWNTCVFCVGGDFINSAVFLNFLFSCASRNGCSTLPSEWNRRVSFLFWRWFRAKEEKSPLCLLKDRYVSHPFPHQIQWGKERVVILI